MRTAPRKEAVGVIVARFQVPELHAGHRYTIDYVLERHKNVLVILGVSYALTDRNPLSFEMRKGMLEALYPGRLTIVGSNSLPSSYEARSKKIDALICESFPGNDAIVYGSRDSFVHRYTGVFKTHEVPVVYSGSATEVRNAISIINSPDFRAGIIYATTHRKPLSHPAVDIAVVHYENREVLLIGKNEEEGKLRFPGVFFDPTADDSYEDAGIRCLRKELPKVRITVPEIIGSSRIDDWRFRKSKEEVVTLLLRARYLEGACAPGKGIDRAQWVGFQHVPSVLIESHRPLAAILHDRWQPQP